MMEKSVPTKTYEHNFLNNWRSRIAQIAEVEIYSQERLDNVEHILKKFKINKTYIKLTNIARLNCIMLARNYCSAIYRNNLGLYSIISKISMSGILSKHSRIVQFYIFYKFIRSSLICLLAVT